MIGFFVFLVSVTAAEVVEMSRKDSNALSRLAYFDEVYLTRHGQFFFLQKSVYLFKVTSSHILTESRLQVDFKSVLVQVKSVSPSKVTPRSV